jgi:hypothetical protein
MIASKIQKATPEEIEHTRSDLKDVNTIIMKILFAESNYVHLWNKWKLEDLPVLEIKTLNKDGSVRTNTESLQHASFQYINAVAILAEADLEKLDAAKLEAGIVTPERAHFFMVTENFFNSFDEAIDEAHNQVEVETDNLTTKVRHESRIF